MPVRRRSLPCCSLKVTDRVSPEALTLGPRRPPRLVRSVVLPKCSPLPPGERANIRWGLHL